MSYVILVRDRQDAKIFVGPLPTVSAAETWMQNNPHHYAFVYPLISAGATAEPVAVVRRFEFGKHRGQTIEQVLLNNPQYIRWAYENVGDHAGITDDEYRQAAGLRPTSQTIVKPVWAADYQDDDIPF